MPDIHPQNGTSILQSPMNNPPIDSGYALKQKRASAKPPMAKKMVPESIVNDNATKRNRATKSLMRNAGKGRYVDENTQMKELEKSEQLIKADVDEMKLKLKLLEAFN